jgi:periplasmic protein TonB
MPRDMFDGITSPHAGVGSRKWYTMPLSMTIHATAVAVLVVVPLMAVDVLPTAPYILAFTVPEPPPSPPPPPAPRHPQTPHQLTTVNPNAAPVEAPSEIRPEPGIDFAFEAAERAEGVPGGVVEGTMAGLPAPPSPPPPTPQEPLPVGGNISRPEKLKDVAPVYPAIARMSRVQGVVIIQAVIDTDGRVRDAKILKSIPLLDEAAIEAVRQWEYVPTRLNGVPVPVVMTVTVNFALQ